MSLALASGCAGRREPVPGVVEIPAGPFAMGTDLDDRAAALESAAASGSASATAARLKQEYRRGKVRVDGFRMMVRPVTEIEYLAFVRATGVPEPWIAREVWEALDTGIPYPTVTPFLWRDGAPPVERHRHPVVLVDHTDASAYCAWWGRSHGARGRLPSEAQWEKAARGTHGWRYPWGRSFDERRANTEEAGVADTTPVDSHPEGGSAYGVADLAGNVFEWTRTQGASTGTWILKGGAWLATAAMARAGARHERPAEIRHVGVGFRCVLDG